MVEPFPATAVGILKTKVCLVGEQAVGKTSLIHRFVSGAFDESYIRTLGAVVSKKVIDLASVGGRPIHMDMTILDVMGKRTFLELFREAYFHGASGILAVADLTRRSTLDALAIWISSVESVSGKLPVFLVVNKADLGDRAEYGVREIEEVAKAFGAEFLLASAKTGDNVEDAFRRLGRMAAEHQLQLH
jgi:small GTP-binding protein